MVEMSRRGFLHASGALALAASAVACDTAPSDGKESGASGLTWWDHQKQLEKTKRRIFREFAQAKGGEPVEYTYNNPERLGQTLQLAKRSRQLPDICSIGSLKLPLPQLIEQGWLAPLDLSDAALQRLDPYLVDGLHRVEGKVYSFPVFDHHSYTPAVWVNTEVAKRADLDPDNPPGSYEEFRKAAAAVKKATGGQSNGWIWHLGNVQRVNDQMLDLAQAAGFTGGQGPFYEGIDFRTGEYAYHSEPFLTVLEFLLSMQQDKLLVPGSQTLVDDEARQRWMAGVAAFYIDGPWTAGVALESAPEFAKQLAAGSVLVPEKGDKPRTYRPQLGGEYWLTAGSKHADKANLLLSNYFTTEEYAVQVADSMSQPPIFPGAVEKSKAHPAYKKLIALSREEVRLGPNPLVRNPEGVYALQGQFKEVEPSFGTVVQGIFSGDLSDPKKALRQLSDKSNAELDRAIKAVKGKGPKVSREDFTWPDWKPDTDYTKDDYA